MTNKKTALITLLALFLVTACGTTSPSLLVSEKIANRITAPVFMTKRNIPTGALSLTTFERMHEKNAAANIYIEGDGFKVKPPYGNNADPTPINPVALHMASKDQAKNIAYLARPCQFDGARDPVCDNDTYWTFGRFAPEVIEAYDLALNDIKARYAIKGFNLIGFSGGGGIATLLAARRSDILTLRTVAGNLDHVTYASHHTQRLWDESLNPLDVAPKLRNLPQAHYIGGQDHVIIPAILQRYIQATGPTNCLTYDLIQEAEHLKGWVPRWPQLLAKTPTCKGPTIQTQPMPMPEFMTHTPPKPIYRPREPDLEKGYSK